MKKTILILISGLGLLTSASPAGADQSFTGIEFIGGTHRGNFVGDIAGGTNLNASTGLLDGTVSNVKLSGGITSAKLAFDSVTVYLSPNDVAVDPAVVAKVDPVNASASPHFFSQGMQQANASSSSFNFGFSVEPDITNIVISYQWVSGLTTGTAHWIDTWTTYYNSPFSRVAGSSTTTNIYCETNRVLDIIISINLPATNAWKQVLLSAAASTNANYRTMPGLLKVVKTK